MTNPLISIIIPAYNYARFLGSCIDSVLAQTYENWELIVIDNGSTDNTVEVLDTFTDSRIRKYRIEINEGPVKAWAMGYSLSRGEFFALLPADDAFTPNKLQRQVEFLQTSPPNTCVGTFIEVIDDDGRPDANNFMLDWINRSVDYTDLREWRWKHHFCIPTALYPKPLCEAAGGVPLDGLTNICDWDFHVRLLGAGAAFSVIPEKLTLYRWHSSNTSKQRSDAHNQWIYSHLCSLLPAIERAAPAELHAEVAGCIETLFLSPRANYFLEDVSDNWRCAHLESLLDPAAARDRFESYREFRAYADAWEINSVNRAAIAAIDRSLMKLREKLIYQKKERTTGAASASPRFPNELFMDSLLVKSAVGLHKVWREIGRGTRRLRRKVSAAIGNTTKTKERLRLSEQRVAVQH